MGLIKDYFNQTSKPEGILGKLMIHSMNIGHSVLSKWALAHLTTIRPAQIVDIGCGGGKNIAALLKKYPDAHVTGIDYSPLSVEQAGKRNKAAISEGRCEVQEGDVSALELDDESFDLATAFETIYFWPGLTKCFTEVAGILKPGGYFLIVTESDGTDAPSLKFEKMIDDMKAHTAEEITDALRAAGFSKVKTDHHKKFSWLLVLAKK